MSASAARYWWSFFRKAGPVTVTHVDLTPNASREASSLLLLNEEEQVRCRQYPLPGPRRRFALCRAALRTILCRQLGCSNERLSFGSSEYGKPFALVDEEPAAISFNLSHSAKHGLIALVPHGRLGVDVEERVPRGDFDELSEAVFGPHEQSALGNVRGRDRTRLFFRLWTIKEALIKALGLGFTLDVSQFEVPPALHQGRVGIFRFPQLPEVHWRVEYIGNEDFSAAIAHELVPSQLGDQSLQRRNGDVLEKQGACQ
ncbi:MAG: 4'-phosphopantetheinyl transferase superfamily protein [Candidatus Dadabacteria bacterium]|nr:4'-phosphopantetheinyl transferase superfamily protein [Candidatus Dadabacteria bacterium]MYC40423.1 4'-phosphopantetheinyl transferase superfamily protein [Candidatus Dadabacteria bacterium]